MSNQETNDEQKSKSLFSEGSRELIAPPFLAARIANELESRKALKQKLSWWRNFAIAGSGLSVALVVVLFLSLTTPTTFQALVGQSTLVQVSLKQLQTGDLARVEITLPNDVVFVSEKYPELNDKNSVSITVETMISLSEFQFIIKSTGSGIKKIIVKVYDREGKLAEEKKLKINFNKG